MKLTSTPVIVPARVFRGCGSGTFTGVTFLSRSDVRWTGVLLGSTATGLPVIDAAAPWIDGRPRTTR